jgi:NADH-quinone oxidoreductase subunit G
MEVESANWVQALAEVASAIATEKGVTAPVNATASAQAIVIAKSLLGGERKAILLGNAAAHHPKATSLLALANWIAENTGASVGYLTEAANTVGAQLAGALPGASGLNAAQLLAGGVKAVLLLNNEPRWDSAAGDKAIQCLDRCDMVVTMSPFKSNMDISDVLLPIAPFTETSGSFINAEGRLQSFHAVVKPKGEARPAWKVLRVLANLLDLPAFNFESSQDVLAKLALNVDASGQVAGNLLSNSLQAAIDLTPASVEPVVAGIYQLDSVVRRATSLQLTADAKAEVSPRQSQGVPA